MIANLKLLDATSTVRKPSIFDISNEDNGPNPLQGKVQTAKARAIRASQEDMTSAKDAYLADC